MTKVHGSAPLGSRDVGEGQAITGDGLTTQWLASRLGVAPELVDQRRRAGEILGVRRPGSASHWYPAWQWDDDFEPRPEIARVIQTARQAGLRDERLYELLTARAGLTGDDRLVDSLREGREDHVLAAIRAAAR
jgi:hypothetical protein